MQKAASLPFFVRVNPFVPQGKPACRQAGATKTEGSAAGRMSLSRACAGRRCWAAVGEIVRDKPRGAGDGERLQSFGPVPKIMGIGKKCRQPYQQLETEEHRGG